MMEEKFSLAETLFSDMVDGRYDLDFSDVEKMASSAIEYAAILRRQQDKTAIEGKSTTYRQKGCPACFGSGGKVNSPCRKCTGSGKINVPV